MFFLCIVVFPLSSWNSSLICWLDLWRIFVFYYNRCFFRFYETCLETRLLLCYFLFFHVYLPYLYCLFFISLPTYCWFIQTLSACPQLMFLYYYILYHFLALLAASFPSSREFQLLFLSFCLVSLSLGGSRSPISPELLLRCSSLNSCFHSIICN